MASHGRSSEPPSRPASRAGAIIQIGARNRLRSAAEPPQGAHRRWRACCRSLRDGPPAFVVGGTIRDLLLGLDPLDLDVVVDGPLTGIVQALGPPLRAHDQFETATVMLGDVRCDLARSRSETYPRPGALPQVRPAPIEQDLLRRDFTVNAIALAISGERAGELLSAPRALDDLDAGRLRVLHRGSFRDDPTRLLRMVRYASRLGFAVDPGTYCVGQRRGVDRRPEDRRRAAGRRRTAAAGRRARPGRGVGRAGAVRARRRDRARLRSRRPRAGRERAGAAGRRGCRPRGAGAGGRVAGDRSRPRRAEFFGRARVRRRAPRPDRRDRPDGTAAGAEAAPRPRRLVDRGGRRPGAASRRSRSPVRWGRPTTPGGGSSSCGS